MPDQQVFSDRYEMVNHIARGGMAQVYLARDLLLDRPVALKVLFPELSVDQNFVERFRREAQAAANLSHPNIVSIYDWGQGENTYYIVMEFVDGPTLSSILRSGPLDAPRAATIGASVAAALDFAHRRGVIHRDVKPGNVLIDERGQVKVADFGIARAVGASQDLTQTGSVMGTATYFSPEQAQGYPVDPRSDVYSLGVVLYEMVAGRPPFSGDSPVSIAYKHVQEAPVPPSQVNPAVPAAYQAIVMKALAKDPAGRYASADELRADLSRFANGEPVLADAAPTTVVPAAATAVMGAAVVPPTRVEREITTVTPAERVLVAEERPRGWLWALLALLILLLLVGGYFAGRSAGLFGGSTKTLTVPSNLANQPLSSAQSELSQMGFTDVSHQAQASSSVKSGNVISSNPGAGTSMKANAPLVLYVSGGPTLVTVPDVTGKDSATATQTLTNAGFVPTVTQQSSATVAQGNVISTNPAGNSQAAKGAAVQVVVSSGKQQVAIPSLVGQSPAAAGQALGALGFKVASANEASSTVAAGQVTRTDPPSGSTEPVGSTVTVYTSTGPSQVQVPDLSNMTQAQASTALSSAGLKGAFTDTPVTSSAQNGIVQSQSPTPGNSVAQGSTVNVTIGQYTATTTTPESTTTTTTQPGQ